MPDVFTTLFHDVLPCVTPADSDSPSDQHLMAKAQNSLTRLYLLADAGKPPLFTRDQLVTCEECGSPMLPNLSTEDEDGYGWACVNVTCADGRHEADEVEAEDLVAVGVPEWLAILVERAIERLAAEREHVAELRSQLPSDHPEYAGS